MKVGMLAPAREIATDELLRRDLQGIALPFEEARLRFLGDLSRRMLCTPELRGDPAAVSLAYWLRPANVQRLKQRLPKAQGLRVPVGRVFHIAPANVDTLFVYSWALSFICGNRNIVRLSTQTSGVTQSTFRCIAAQMADSPEVCADAFVTYAHDDAITAAFSDWCSHRVVWGGDQTVRAIRAIPLPPHASERVFGTKFSYAVIDAAAYLAMPDAERVALAEACFNDVFWFDQMACSSPHVVFWLGETDAIPQCETEFNAQLQSVVARRGYVVTDSQSVHRLNFAFESAIDRRVEVNLGHAGFVSLHAAETSAVGKAACGAGLMTHTHLKSLDAIADFVAESDQTITFAGLDELQLARLAAIAGMRGVDRIVQMGQALAFDAVWDGFDLLCDFTRIVSLPAR
jgi:hypothetical protein